MQQETEVEDQMVEDTWLESVHDLWTEYLPHIREIILDTDLAFIHEPLYGFPIAEDDVCSEDGLSEDIQMESIIRQTKMEHNSSK